jgi:hypothetical protein
MLASLCSIVPVLFLAGGNDVLPHPAGYLVSKRVCDRDGAQTAVAYEPREGDLIFYDDHSKIWTALFTLAGTGPPLHMGIVVRKKEGRLAVLEAGPDDTVWVELRDLVPRLHQFHNDFNGTITIRRGKLALNRFQSAGLTQFAEAQNGKRYAVLRLLAQGTPLRSRGPLEPWLGKTSVERHSWICSEISVAGGTVAGLIDPAVVHSNVAYPRDLADNQRYDLSTSWEDAVLWRPTAPRCPLVSALR